MAIFERSRAGVTATIAGSTFLRGVRPMVASAAMAHIMKIGPAITPESLRVTAALRKKLRNGDGTFARDQVRQSRSAWKS